MIPRLVFLIFDNYQVEKSSNYTSQHTLSRLALYESSKEINENLPSITVLY
jgi:hypothetical protein